MFKKKELTAENLVREAITTHWSAQAAFLAAMTLWLSTIVLAFAGFELTENHVMWAAGLGLLLLAYVPFRLIDDSHKTRKRYATAIIELLTPEYRLVLANIVKRDKYCEGHLYNNHLRKLVDMWDQERSRLKHESLVAELSKGTEHLEKQNEETTNPAKPPFGRSFKPSPYRSTVDRRPGGRYVNSKFGMVFRE